MLVPVRVLNLSNMRKVLKKGTIFTHCQNDTTVINHDPQEDDNVNSVAFVVDIASQ